MVWISRRHHTIRQKLSARSHQGDPHNTSSWPPCTVISLLTCTGRHCSYPQAASRSPSCGLPYQDNWVYLSPCPAGTHTDAAFLQKPCQGHSQTKHYTPLPLALHPLYASISAHNHHCVTVTIASRLTHTAWSHTPSIREHPPIYCLPGTHLTSLITGQAMHICQSTYNIACMAPAGC